MNSCSTKHIGLSSAYPAPRRVTGLVPGCNGGKIDLRDPDPIQRLIKYERPDLIFHLAAQANVPLSWQNPWATYETNVRGTLNLFDALIVNKVTPRILVVGSNEVYGAPSSPDDVPFTEDHPLRPNNPLWRQQVSSRKTGTAISLQPWAGCAGLSGHSTTLARSKMPITWFPALRARLLKSRPVSRNR